MLTPYTEEHSGSSSRWGSEKSPVMDGGQRNRHGEDWQKRREARKRSSQNTAAEGGDGCLTWWGRVMDLQQVEDNESQDAGRPKQGNLKTNEKTRKKPPGLDHQVNS